MNKLAKRMLLLAVMMIALVVLPAMTMAESKLPEKIDPYTRSDGKGMSIDLSSFAFEKSLQIKLYSGNTLLTVVEPRETVDAGETLIKPGSYPKGTTVSVRVTGEAGSWKQTKLWTNKNLEPNKVVVVVDGSSKTHNFTINPAVFAPWADVVANMRTVGGDINGVAGFRSDNTGIPVELHDVVFAEKLELYVYSGSTLLTIVENRAEYVAPGEYDALTVSVRTGSEESTSWKQTRTWYPTNEQMPTKLALYVDGQQVDTYTLNLNAEEWAKQEKRTANAPTVSADSLPKTGDESNLMLFALLLAVSAAGMMVLRRRRTDC